MFVCGINETGGVAYSYRIFGKDNTDCVWEWVDGYRKNYIFVSFVHILWVDVRACVCVTEINISQRGRTVKGQGKTVRVCEAVFIKSVGRMGHMWKLSRKTSFSVRYYILKVRDTCWGSGMG